MSVKSEKVDTNVVELEFEVGAEEFEKAMQKSYIKNVKKINIPGFRKGKAPRKFIEKIYGEAIFYDDAINFVLPDAYDNAVKEAKIEPVSRPEVDIKQLPENGQNLILTAKVTVKPEVRLSKFDTIDIVKHEHPVTDADVARELNELQQKNARIITVEDRAAQAGDIVVIDYEGFVDGKAFEGGKAEGYELELGSNHFIPGFEDALIGKNADTEFDIDVTFPEEYHAEELKGKPAVFKVKLHSIKRKELPTLDDELAKDVSEFDTLDALKADILAKLKEAAEQREKRETEDAAVAFVVSKMKVQVPDVMIESRIDELINDFGMRLSYQGMSMEQYLSYTGMDQQAFRGQFKQQAENQVKSMLALEAMAKREKIKASKDDIAAEYEKMAKDYNMEVDKIKTLISEEDVAHNVVTNKTIDALLGMVNFVEEEPKQEVAAAKDEDKEKEKKPRTRRTKKAEAADEAAAEKAKDGEAK